MRFALRASFLVLAMGVVSFADSKDIDGNWTVEYVDGLAMKTIGGAEFEFDASGPHLTGTANIGVGWPGKAPISSGKIDGEHISFTVLGKQASSDGLPKMDFAGTIHANKIKLTMTFYADGKKITGQTEFAGKRTPKK
jgi:hypothetical protein